MQQWPAYIDLKNRIEYVNEISILLEQIKNSSMKQRHWKSLSALVGFEFDVENPKFTLGKFFSVPILKYKDEIEDICTGAIKEQDIESKLKQVITEWSMINLQLAPFKNRGNLLLKGQETLDIMTHIDDSLMIMNSLVTNRYNTAFKKDIINWLSKLVTMNEVLDKWLTVQNLWLYLEAVFIGGDIAKQLPLEAKRFANIDKNFVKIMMRARETENAIECCTGDDTILTVLNFLLEQLEICQKSLAGKRMFFFLIIIFDLVILNLESLIKKRKR